MVLTREYCYFGVLFSFSERVVLLLSVFLPYFCNKQ